MKKLLLLALGVIVALPALSQTKKLIILDTDGTWQEKSIKDVTLSAGTTEVDVSDATVAMYFTVPTGTKKISVVIGAATPAPLTIQAINYVSMSGVTKNSDNIGSTDKNDWASYSAAMSGYTKLTLEYAREWSTPSTGGSFELREGSTTGKVIASGNTPNTGGWSTFKTLTFSLTSSTATTVVLLFTTSGAATGNIKSLKFE